MYKKGIKQSQNKPMETTGMVVNKGSSWGRGRASGDTLLLLAGVGRRKRKNSYATIKTFLVKMKI